MDKGSGDQHASTEMADSKEEAIGDPQPWELGSHDGERTSECRDEQDNEEGTDMERSVVFILVDASRFAGARSLVQRREVDRNRLLDDGG